MNEFIAHSGDVVPRNMRIATAEISGQSPCCFPYDFDLPNAYLKVEQNDPMSGELAVVVRDAGSGVSWNVWPIHAE